MKIDLTPPELFAVYDALSKVRPTFVTQVASEKIKNVMLSSMEDKSEKSLKWDMISLEQWEKEQMLKMKGMFKTDYFDDQSDNLTMEDDTFFKKCTSPTLKLPSRTQGRFQRILNRRK